MVRIVSILLFIAFAGAVVAGSVAEAASPDILLAQNDAVDIPQNPPPAAAVQQPSVAPGKLAEALEGTPYSTGLADAPTGWVTFKTPFEQTIVIMTVATLAITLAALILMGWRAGLTPEFTRAFIVVVIVFAALFLIAAGYSDKQAAPVYALLGTIVGYIFGKMDKRDEAAPAQPAEGAKLVDDPKLPMDDPKLEGAK